MSILLKNIFKKGSEKESSCVLLLRLQNRVVSAAARPVWGHLALPCVRGLGAGRLLSPPCPFGRRGSGPVGLSRAEVAPVGPLRAASKCCLGFCVFSLLGAGMTYAWTSWGTSGDQLLGACVPPPMLEGARCSNREGPGSPGEGAPGVGWT